MTDDRISLLARAYHADKGDLEAARGLVAAYQRTGREVPYALRLATSDLFAELPCNAQGMAEFRHRTTGAVFVLIPAGEFLMGSPEGEGSDDERPQHRRVFSEPFLMAKYPFTGGEWFRITGEAPSHFPTEGAGASRLSRMDSDGRLWGDHPVESVSWDHCREVVDRINRLDFARSSGARFKSADETWVSWAEVEWGDESMHLAPHPRREDGEVDVAILGLLAFDETDEAIYQAWLWNDAGERVGFQLPTEACWEYATRAGSNTQYPNGDTLADLDQIAWYGGNWRDGHKSVGLKKPNAWGLHDVVGNVFEWTRSAWTRNYEGAPENGFAGDEQRPDPTPAGASIEAARGNSPRHSAGWPGAIGTMQPTGSITLASVPHGASSEGEQSSDPTSCASTEAAVGTAPRPTAARPFATGSESRATDSLTSASVPPGVDGEQRSDPTPGASFEARVGTTPSPPVARPTAGQPQGGVSTWASAQPGGAEDEQSPDPTPGASAGFFAPAAGTVPSVTAARPTGIMSSRPLGVATSAFALFADVEVEQRPDPTSIGAEVGGATPRSAVARPGVPGTGRASGSTTSASAPPGEAEGEQSSDPTSGASPGASVGRSPRSTVARPDVAIAPRSPGSPTSASAPHGEAEGEQGSDPTSGASFVPAPGVTLRPSAARPCAAETCLDGATTSASDPSIAEGEQSSDPTAGASVAAVVGPTPRPSVSRPIGGRSQGGDSTLDSALPGEPLEVEESSDPIHPTRPCAAAVGAVGSRAWRQPLYDTERFPAATVVSPIRIFSAFYNQPAAAAASHRGGGQPPRRRPAPLRLVGASSRPGPGQAGFPRLQPGLPPSLAWRTYSMSQDAIVQLAWRTFCEDPTEANALAYCVRRNRAEGNPDLHSLTYPEAVARLGEGDVSKAMRTNVLTAFAKVALQAWGARGVRPALRGDLVPMETWARDVTLADFRKNYNCGAKTTALVERVFELCGLTIREGDFQISSVEDGHEWQDFEEAYYQMRGSWGEAVRDVNQLRTENERLKRKLDRKLKCV